MNKREKTIRTDILIIGAGISGLTAGFRLKQQNLDFIITEASENPGGAIESKKSNGWILENGPNTLLVTNKYVQNVIDECGLSDDVIHASKRAKNRYIVRNRVPLALPTSPVALFSSPLFSLKTKMGIMAEPFRKKGADPDESLGSFVRRRLGQEFLDYAINPFVAGVYSGDPDLLSTRLAFPKLWDIEQKHGSLIMGAIKGPGKDADPTDIPRSKAGMITFKNGNDSLTYALSEKLSGRLKLNHKVDKIQPENEGYTVSFKGNNPSVFASKVIITTPLHSAGSFFGDDIKDLFANDELIKYPAVNVVHFGFTADQIRHPLDGFGMLIPEKEKLSLLGTLFNSSLFPGRTPDENHVLLTCFVGGVRNPEIAALNDDEMTKSVLKDLSNILGISGDPLMTHIRRWPRAIPQYGLEYQKVYNALENIEGTYPGIHFLGNFRNGISVPDCIKNGWRLAEEIGSQTTAD